jgi:[glutamine synthetase] adenylyltransferase / [glutamine synthetase]-adenylyl-L-tyrosine phosphorylase
VDTPSSPTGNGADARPSPLLSPLPSPFYARATQADPSLGGSIPQLISQPVTPEQIRRWWVEGRDLPDLTKKLRLWRNQVLVVLATRSQSGLANLEETGAAMTALAEQALDIAFTEATQQMQGLYGQALDAQGQPQSILVVGMGKLGGNELNVSSDIDLVLLYRSPGFSTGDSIGQGQLASSDYFARLIRIAVPLLQEATTHGFVFRVDLRLRPHGDSGPPAVSFNYLEDYLLTEGRAWERFAWSKARLIYGANEPQDVDQFEQLINPFVFRRYLDFSAIAAINDLHQKIQREQFSKNQRNEGFDVKLGRGGIRQIEFTVQLIQIMRAGKDPSLRQANTLKALARLVAARHLSAQDGQVLSDAYRLLRDVEHALQWYDDQQTHWFDTTLTQKTAYVAQLLRVDFELLNRNLEQARIQVASVFDRAMGSNKSNASVSNLATQADIPLPFANQERFSRQSEANQALIARIWQQGNALQAVQPRWERLIETLMGRPGYLALLDNNPQALERLIKLLSHNQWAANYLTRYPIVIDDLLAPDWLTPTNWQAVAIELREQLLHCRLPGSAAPDVERQIDALRELHHAYTLRLLAQEIEGVLTVMALADQLSALADLLIQAALDCIAPGMSGLAVIAYGKLGTKELGYASDLDLVFLTELSTEADVQAHVKVVRKLIHWLTVQTGAGSLFEVDLRLRPDGDAGLVVSSIEAFGQYQEKSAWLWEHQALTRARFCAGDAQVGKQFEALRIKILTRPRDPNEVRTTIVTMRSKVHDGHPNRTTDFDLKHDSGGMVDIEFMVQALVLLHGAKQPQLLDNRGVVALLSMAAEVGLLAKDAAQQLGEIYIRLRKAQYDWRLDHSTQARVAPEPWTNDRKSVTQLWSQLMMHD